MKTTIISTFVFLILLLSASANLQHYYQIELNYNYGELSYTTINVIPSTETLETPGANYIAEIIYSNNKAINRTYFGIPIEILWDGLNPITGKIDRGGSIKLNQSKVTLYLPYYENAREIRIYDQDLNKKLTLDVSSFAKETETIAEPEEQLLQHEEQDEKIVPEEEKAEPLSGTSQTLIWILIGLGLITLLTSIIIILRKRKK